MLPKVTSSSSSSASETFRYSCLYLIFYLSLTVALPPSDSHHDLESTSNDLYLFDMFVEDGSRNGSSVSVDELRQRVLEFLAKKNDTNMQLHTGEIVLGNSEHGCMNSSRLNESLVSLDSGLKIINRELHTNFELIKHYFNINDRNTGAAGIHNMVEKFNEILEVEFGEFHKEMEKYISTGQSNLSHLIKQVFHNLRNEIENIDCSTSELLPEQISNITELQLKLQKQAASVRDALMNSIKELLSKVNHLVEIVTKVQHAQNASHVNIHQILLDLFQKQSQTTNTLVEVRTSLTTFSTSTRDHFKLLSDRMQSLESKQEAMVIDITNDTNEFRNEMKNLFLEQSQVITKHQQMMEQRLNEIQAQFVTNVERLSNEVQTIADKQTNIIKNINDISQYTTGQGSTSAAIMELKNFFYAVLSKVKGVNQNIQLHALAVEDRLAQIEHKLGIEGNIQNMIVTWTKGIKKSSKNAGVMLVDLEKEKPSSSYEELLDVFGSEKTDKDNDEVSVDDFLINEEKDKEFHDNKEALYMNDDFGIIDYKFDSKNYHTNSPIGD